MYLAGASNFLIACPTVMLIIPHSYPILSYPILSIRGGGYDDDDLPYVVLLSSFGYLHLVSVVAASFCLFHPVPTVWFVIPTVVNGITWCMSCFGQHAASDGDGAFAKRVSAWLANMGF